MMQTSPSFQSNQKISAAATKGTSTAPAKSGNWWARKLWVILALSSIILRMRPLVLQSKNPRGIATIRRIASRRKLDSTRKAARCDAINAVK